MQKQESERLCSEGIEFLCFVFEESCFRCVHGETRFFELGQPIWTKVDDVYLLAAPRYQCTLKGGIAEGNVV